MKIQYTHLSNEDSKNSVPLCVFSSLLSTWHFIERILFVRKLAHILRISAQEEGQSSFTKFFHVNDNLWLFLGKPELKITAAKMNFDYCWVYTSLTHFTLIEFPNIQLSKISRTYGTWPCQDKNKHSSSVPWNGRC